MSISIVVMAYNRARLLRECLESIARQRFSPYEVIIVDDGSTDGTASAIAPFLKSHRRFRAFKHTVNQGVGAARNTGLQYARYPYVAFIADDYILPDTYLRDMSDFIHTHPDAALVRSLIVPGQHTGYASSVDALMFHATIRLQAFCEHRITLLKRMRYLFTRYMPEHIQRNTVMPAAYAAVYKKSILKQVRGFDASLRQGEDYEMLPRILKLSKELYFCPDITVHRAYTQTLTSLLRNQLCAGATMRNIPLWKAPSFMLGGFFDMLLFIKQVHGLQKLTYTPGFMLSIISFRLGYILAKLRLL